MRAGVAGGRSRKDLDTVIAAAGRNQALVDRVRLPCREAPRIPRPEGCFRGEMANTGRGAPEYGSACIYGGLAGGSY